MTKAQGYNTHTLLAREAVPGTSPGGNFLNFAVLSNSLGKTSENVTDQLAGQGRDMTETYPDVNAVNGDMRMPVCLRAFGHILTGIFGNAVTTENAGVFTHTFKSGALALPSYAIETAHKGPGLFNLALGVMMNTLTMPFATGGGRAEATVGLIGRTETPYAATQGGVPTELTAARVSKFSGTIKKGGVALGDVTSATLTYNNNLSGELELNSGADIAQIDVGSTLLTLAASTRFSNKALFDEAAARTPADIELEYRISDDMKLTLTIHQAIPNVPKAPIEGPGGYGMDFTYTGILNSVAGCALTAVLVNDVDGAVYTPA